MILLLPKNKLVYTQKESGKLNLMSSLTFKFLQNKKTQLNIPRNFLIQGTKSSNLLKYRLLMIKINNINNCN